MSYVKPTNQQKMSFEKYRSSKIHPKYQYIWIIFERSTYPVEGLTFINNSLSNGGIKEELITSDVRSNTSSRKT